MNNVIVENMYLCLSTSAYETVPVRQSIDDEGNTINETLAMIFPEAPKYPLQDRVLCGVETKAKDIPLVEAVAVGMGFTVSWGPDSTKDVEILMSIADEVLARKVELSLFESTHYLDENGIVQEVVQNVTV